jgi:hypothetical protein
MRETTVGRVMRPRNLSDFEYVADCEQRYARENYASHRGVTIITSHRVPRESNSAGPRLGIAHELADGGGSHGCSDYSG